MKKLLIPLAAALSLMLGSCGDYTQIVTVVPTSDQIKKTNENFYEYENNDLKVRYSFWGEHGIMGFIVYNKTDHPIYIDWKKSNMISGEEQKRYYTNKTVSNFSAYGSSYGTGWINMFNGVGVASSSSHMVGSQTIVKPERITFISPKSYIANAFYNLTANIYFDISERHTDKSEVDGAEVYISRPKSDITFRNYLTYSDNEDFTTEKYIDNGFKVSKIYTMGTDDFEEIDVNGNSHNSWKRPSRFYITDLNEEDVFKSDSKAERL